MSEVPNISDGKYISDGPRYEQANDQLPRAACEYCTIEPSYPNNVYSNGTSNVTVFQDNPPSVSSFEDYLFMSEFGVDFTAYTSFSESWNGNDCITSSTESVLSTPFFVPVGSNFTDPYTLFQISAQFSFYTHLNLPNCACTLASPENPMSASLSSLSHTLSLSSFSRSAVPFQPTATLSSSSSLRSALPSQPIATTATSLSSQGTHSSSGSTGETTKLVIGLAIAIVVPILLVTIGLAYFCIIRRRRRRKEEVATAPHQDVTTTDGEGENPQLYFQQKVELDDEQRRHEMEAAEIRFEMEGEDQIHEMPVEDRGRDCGRQELRGEEHSRELDNAL